MERGWGTSPKSLSRKEVLLAAVPGTPCLSGTLQPYSIQNAGNRMDSCAVGAGTGSRRDNTKLGEPIFGHLTEEVTSRGFGDEGGS